MKEVYEGDETSQKPADPWELVSNAMSPNNISVATERMRVPGGWLYRSVSRLEYPQTSALAMVFVPAEEHHANGGGGMPGAGLGEPQRPFVPPEDRGYDA